ncbi:hypothetical protein KBC75_04395 [Candidatus Shapirobacteria bacterium]|nr:hypothetical protein [Candidatus Shapirobacteria bacterium]
MADKMNLNLLPSQARFQASKVKLKLKARTVMAVLVVVWMVVMVGTYTAELIVNARLKMLTNKKNSAIASVNAMSEQVMVNQNLKYKSKLVGKALSQRFEYGKAFEKVNSLFPEGIKLTSFELESRGNFKVSGTTQGKENVDKLERLITNINEGNDEKFSSIMMNSLAVKGDTWSFDMEARVK